MNRLLFLLLLIGCTKPIPSRPASPAYDHQAFAAEEFQRAKNALAAGDRDEAILILQNIQEEWPDEVSDEVGRLLKSLTGSTR